MKLLNSLTFLTIVLAGKKHLEWIGKYKTLFLKNKGNNLNKRGILARKAPDIQATRTCLRFTLGPTSYMKKLAENLKKYSKK